MSIIEDWVCHLQAAGKARRTVEVYQQAAESWTDYLDGGDPTEAGRKELEAWVAALASRPNRRRPGRKLSQAYVSQHYRAVQQLYRWLHEVEKEIDENPFARMSAPQVAEKPVDVLTEDQLKALLSVCEGTDFYQRRDMAMIRLFIDTGARRAEIAKLRLEDVDLKLQTVRVVGKGGRVRIIPFGTKTAEALRRYLRKRARDPHAESPKLWLGKVGPLQPDSVRLMLKRRAKEAGVPNVHPHKFRHTFAHRWLADGNGEIDLMRLCGWKSRRMLEIYGASAADERARAAHRRAALGDRL
ncbi:tyrosine-type recombinase/integrase [Pseudonocardia acaciae]|uniref:tyrosine-type recombinase/integrase n=1 Tax=Pseudonocardia acaciae TaxID=551276 RepID=UPI000A69C29B|nr:tyrosine-type recombinase/integrase [Pseudonocardia acaciae]